MSTPLDRAAAAVAGVDLRILQHWESFCGWLLLQTAKWPKSARFTLTQRLENHALDVTEMLVTARYEPQQRPSLLRSVNLRLERMRFLCRLARAGQLATPAAFERACRDLDDCGRMLHGWRVAIGERRGTPPPEAHA
jgi:hypothetical protein